MNHRTHPALRLVVAALLLAQAFLLWTPAASAATVRVLVITSQSAGPILPFAEFDGNPVKLFDIDGDGDKEIIAQNDNQYVYVFDSRTGQLLFEAKTTLPPGWGARSFNGPEVAILSDDAKVHLVVANSAATITSFVFDPAQSSGTRFVFHKEWERRLNDCHSNPGMDSKPVFGDLDRDGKFEIIASTEENGLYVLKRDGTLFWKKCIPGGNAEPTIGDVNQDGRPDIVFGSDTGTVWAIDGPSNATIWSFYVPGRFSIGAGSMPVGATIAQLDGVGGPDVVVGVRDSHDSNNPANNHALLLALNSNGALLWGRQDAAAHGLTYTHPVVVDAAGDGQAEVYWGDWNTNGHNPPFDEDLAWQRLGPAHFYRYDRQGNLVWRQTLETIWSNKDTPLADVDGDGVQEMLANGPNALGHDGIWYLDTRDGTKETFVDTYPWQVQRAPVVSDLYGAGTMQWVVEAAGAPADGGPAILVYDTGKPYNSAWPHLPEPVRGTPPPPPPGQFAATFTIKSPNAWWQEVTVSPASPRTLAKVEIRIACSFWRPMALRTWGAWTSSFNTVAGTRVEFLATDSNGFVSQSAPFTWLDGTLTKSSVPYGDCAPPPTPSFAATYVVPPGVNEWWVEVQVTANEPINAVHARVNGGAWRSLPRQSWGNWADSFFVETGSLVQFRATSSTGATNLSQTYRWLIPDGDPGPFTATFTPCCTDNNWWVEVRVTSTHIVSSVDVRVNGGAWQSLPKTSWGTWAKSFFVADGSQVQFRATDTAGDTALSSTYTWG